MTDAPDRLLLLDLETTGLNPGHGKDDDKLLQVAAIGVDLDLNELTEPFERVVHHDEEATRYLREHVANDFVRDMHDATGLWDRLPGGTPLDRIDQELADFTTSFAPGRRQARLAGNSVSGVDVPFSNLFLPRAKGLLHYRVLDVSAVAFYAAEIAGYAPGYFEKAKTHDALSDIRECLEELRWIRGHAR